MISFLCKVKELLAVSITAACMLAMPARAEDGAQASALLSVLSAQWWQMFGSIPPAVNPAVDPTGAYCMVGQRGEFWFLAGTFSPTGKATRTCTVPEYKALFIPILNVSNIDTPNLCGQTKSKTVAQLRAELDVALDPVTLVSLTVDGRQSSAVRRVKSPVFEFHFPANSVLEPFCGDPGSLPAGVYSPAVGDGYYALLPPLSVGTHKLHLRAEVQGGGVAQDVSYTLKIVPVRLR